MQGCKELVERAAQHRGTVPYIVAFAPRTPGGVDGPRVWNDQLVRFACYERSDETLLGDPANKAFTDFVIRALGWKPPARRSAFDVLPLMLQAGPGEDPLLFELPPWYVSRISIKHNQAPWLSDMGIKWNAFPLYSNQELLLGGLTYTAVPCSGWCVFMLCQSRLVVQGLTHGISCNTQARASSQPCVLDFDVPTRRFGLGVDLVAAPAKCCKRYALCCGVEAHAKFAQFGTCVA
jgi:nitric oxide synthase oxygenase domain/subunit